MNGDKTGVNDLGVNSKRVSFLESKCLEGEGELPGYR